MSASRLLTGEELRIEQQLTSPDGSHRLLMQGDGNLVIYSRSGATWATGTEGKGDVRTVMQGDGNVVIYSADGKAIWATGTDGNPGAKLVLGDSGRLEVMDKDNKGIWSNQKMHIPEAWEFPLGWDITVGVAVMANPILGTLVNVSRGIAHGAKCTIGIGPRASAGAGVGGSLEAGLLILQNGRLGGYGSGSVVAGLVGSVSGTWQCTIIRGDWNNVRGEALLVGGGGGEVVVGNAEILVKPSTGEFLGISAGFGLGAGLPLELYYGAQATYVPGASIPHADVLPGAPHKEGRWASIRSGHELIQMHDGRVLDWVPSSGQWRLWNYDANSGDILPGNPHKEGRWASIRSGHQLIPMHDGRVLDWVPSSGEWRLWNYNANAGDILPGSPHKGGRWASIRSGHELIRMHDGRVLDWVPSSGEWRLWNYDPNAGDILPGDPHSEGNWASIRSGHELLLMHDGRVLDWVPSSGGWRLWNYRA
ncbi:MAG: hypothetical protein R3C18_10595 [Planctomycetaceae bacterium]